MPTVMINGAIRQYDKGTTFENIVREYQPKYDYSIGSDALMEMIDGIYGLLVQLYNSGKSELAELMEQVVYHKKGNSIDEK